MQRTYFSFLLAALCLSAQAQQAQNVLLRLAPEADAPVIAKVILSQKVVLDAAPAPRNAEAGWRQLPLPTPFEGYVPTASMDKSFSIFESTAVRYLPTADAARITQVEPGDTYEVVRVKDEWATVRFRKDIIGYFLDDRSESAPIELPPAAPDPAPITPPLPIAIPEFDSPSRPLTIPAPRGQINPDAPIAQIDPDSLPPENVIWKPAPAPPSNTPAPAPRARIGTVGTREPVMVTPEQTQAREAAPGFGPAKAPRLLTGVLAQDLAATDAPYPLRLLSPEGRLIAYVDLSRVYVSTLDPYLGEKVYLRGEIHPLPGAGARLVILTQSLRLAE